MRVLLVSPTGGWTSFDGDIGAGSRDFGDYLGIRYLAAVARELGHEVELIDAHFQHLSLDAVNERVRAAAARPFDVIGISGIEHTIPRLMAVLPECRRAHPGATICVGGYMGTFWWQELLSAAPAIDVVVVGEGEATFAELLDCMAGGQAWQHIAGIAYRNAAGVPARNPGRAPCDLDQLPRPARDTHYPRGYANILSSRGCYGSCTFCSIIQFYDRGPGKVRVRQPRAVAEEIAELGARGVRHVDFVDDNFVSGAKQGGWVDEFCHAAKSLGTRITFGVQMRPDDVDHEMLKKLKAAGLKIVSIGVESDRESRLKVMGKRTTKALNRDAIKTLVGLGLTTYIEMLLFTPDTDLDEIEENIEFLREVEYWRHIRCTPATFLHELQLYRGIPLLQYYERKGLARLDDKGFGYRYEYQSPEVPALLARLRMWREYASAAANHHLAYYQYPLAAAGNAGSAMAVVRLSRKFLAYDLDIFSHLVACVREHAADSSVVTWMNQQIPRLRQFEQAFARLGQQVPGRVPYQPGVHHEC